MCVDGVWGAQSAEAGGDVGSMLNLGVGLQTRPALEQTIRYFKDFTLQNKFIITVEENIKKRKH